MSSYYALTLNAQGTNAPAFFSLIPTSNLTISQGGVTLAPSSATSQMVIVSVYPEMLQISAPAGLVSAGVTIVTSENKISGQVTVSPAITVATVITLYGNGGQQIGQHIIDPGTSEGAFSFPVNSSESMGSADEARKVLQQTVAQS